MKIDLKVYTRWLIVTVGYQQLRGLEKGQTGHGNTDNTYRDFLFIDTQIVLLSTHQEIKHTFIVLVLCDPGPFLLNPWLKMLSQ